MRWRGTAAVGAAVAAVVAGYLTWAGLTGVSGARAAADLAVAGRPAGSLQLQRDFAAAAAEFHVPVSVLLAVSYQETQWDSHGGHISFTGNYNVMGLTELDPSDAAPLTTAQKRAMLGGRGKGPEQVPAAALAAVNKIPAGDPALHTLVAAAKLIGASDASLRTSMRQSVRGGAALLARYERAATGTLPTDPGQWYAAVARYSQASDVSGAKLFAGRVYGLIRDGVSAVTPQGQVVTLAADPSVVPDASQLSSLGLQAATTTAGFTPECPSGLDCLYTAAAYVQTSSSNYGNYDLASRPSDGDAISYIVIHDTEGSYAGTISAFQNPYSEVSANYVIQSSTGQVTQMVPTADIAWHAGNWYMNMHAIGIEHEGYALQGATWYTYSEYQSSAELVHYLAGRFGIPLDREHIIGHDDVPGPTDSYVAGMHWDPGPYWNWSSYLAKAGGTINGQVGSIPLVGGEITINPPFSSSYEPVVTSCPSSGCTLPAQPANFVYLHVTPSFTSALLSDPYLDTSGTTQADDWGDKAVEGQTFVVAAEQGPWTAIWYAGQEAWFYNPGDEYATPDTLTPHNLIEAKAGASSIPVYGRAYPECAAYPSGNCPSGTAVVSLSKYSIPAGQAYAAGPAVASDFFDANYIPPGTANTNTLYTGTTQYYPIRYNHRIAFVRASDVQVVQSQYVPPGRYRPLGPVRVLDTRNGTGGIAGPVAGGATVALQVAGRDGVPASGVTAVVLNVTAVKPAARGFVTVFPDGISVPNASNLNFTAGEVVPNLVVVPVGAGGKVDFHVTSSGSVNLVADLSGYYSG